MDPQGTENAEAYCSTHLIDGDGTLNAAGLESLTKGVKLAECGISYAVVSIMGPQSSGKSTLLNLLFKTKFAEMDSRKKRSQTTKGIWLANCVGIKPCTIVMDIEGTDGSERGEDDTVFERQSALFALAVSDIVLINMWWNDVNREHAANKPLLRTVFQVMMQLFPPRKTTLIFVIRDTTKRTPLDIIESQLKDSIQKIWDSVPKPEARKETSLSEVFNVEVVALSNFELEEEKFTEQVAILRQRFFHSIAPGGLAGDRWGVVPASSFSLSAKQIWTDIKANKDLDLPAHKVMLATVRCQEIFDEKYSSFIANAEWCEVRGAVQFHPVPQFGRKLSSILETYLSGYDAETTYYEDRVRSAKRKQLEENLLQVVEPAYQSMLEHIVSETLDKFKDALDHALNGGQGFAVAARDCKATYMESFDVGCADVIVEQANWDNASKRDKLHRDMDAHVASVRTTKLSELQTLYESKLKEALSGPVATLLDGASKETWPEIRRLFLLETETVVSGCSAALARYDMDEDTKKIMLSKLEDFARGVVESLTKEKSVMVLVLMKDRFSTFFSHDSNSMLRVWTGKEDIGAITKTAESSSLELLSILAAILLDDDVDVDPLAPSTWERVPATKILITPVQCKSLWRQFQSDTGVTITQAIASKVTAATVCCEEIANEIYLSFNANEEWSKLKDDVKYDPVPHFREKLSSILDTCLSKYEEETRGYEGRVRSAKRKQLEEKLVKLVKPAYHSMLEHIRSEILANFKDALYCAMNGRQEFAKAVRDCSTTSKKHFDQRCADVEIKGANWDSKTARIRLVHDMELAAHKVINAHDQQNKYRGKNPFEYLATAVGTVVLAPLMIVGEIIARNVPITAIPNQLLISNETVDAEEDITEEDIPNQLLIINETVDAEEDITEETSFFA